MQQLTGKLVSVHAGARDDYSKPVLDKTAFSKAAKLSRGLVGVIEVGGVLRAGDEVTVKVYEHPSWLRR